MAGVKPIDRLKMRSEAEEQAAVIDWAWNVAPTLSMPSLRLIYAIPNGAWLKNGGYQAVRLKAEGLKAGMPDLCLPISRLGFNALYIEMKKRGGKWTLTGEQLGRAKELTGQGNLVALCQGSNAAIDLLLRYIARSHGLHAEAVARRPEGYIRCR